MTTPSTQGNQLGGGVSGGASGSVASNFSEWDDVVPKKVTMEDSMSEAESARTWEAVYRHAGMSSASEKEKRAVRAGIYVYCALNGTSREGSYNAPIQLSTGTIISASVIPRAASKMKIRKFLRANMSEAYRFFKQTRIMETYERFVASCAKHGISPENAFATADFLTECPDFTPDESKAHNAMFAHSIERARRAREGKSLEQVEDARVENELTAGGPLSAAETNGLSHW
jgi:hypothetical protein